MHCFRKCKEAKMLQDTELNLTGKSDLIKNLLSANAILQLKPGCTMLITSDGDPKSLVQELDYLSGGDEYKWEDVKAGPQEWCLRVTKKFPH
jgi:uncharacterized protein (DUF2249 family)